MNGQSEEMMRAAMIEQAAAWQARCLSGEMSSAEKVEFLKWLQETINPGTGCVMRFMGWAW